MEKELETFNLFILKTQHIKSKAELINEAQKEFNFTRDRSVYYNDFLAVRFSETKTDSFSNTVIALSKLQKYNSIPFIVCVISPQRNYTLIANASHIHKVSHSSQSLRVDNIRGSINGSDITRDIAGIKNIPSNFSDLFAIHTEYAFEDNLARLVESTNSITPTGKRFEPTPEELNNIINSPTRAKEFLNSTYYDELNHDLNQRIHSAKDEIITASIIDNVNVRGRTIEFFITSDDTEEKEKAFSKLLARESYSPPTDQNLGDYEKNFDLYHTKTDIKSKMLFLGSNPAGYNLDKCLRFLALENSVFMIFMVGITNDNEIKTRLCSIFNSQLLDSTRIMSQWAGRASRGGTQFMGKELDDIIYHFDKTISITQSREFISHILDI